MVKEIFFSLFLFIVFFTTDIINSNFSLVNITDAFNETNLDDLNETNVSNEYDNDEEEIIYINLDDYIEENSNDNSFYSLEIIEEEYEETEDEINNDLNEDETIASDEYDDEIIYIDLDDNVEESPFDSDDTEVYIDVENYLEKNPNDNSFYSFSSSKRGNGSFISTWRTSSNSEEIILPLFNGGNYDFYVNWGDESGDYYIDSYNSPNATHEYENPGTYVVTIDGTLEGWNFGKVPNSKDNIIDITHWGDLKLTNPSNSLTDIGGYFYNATNLNDISATDLPQLNFVKNMENMFYEASSFNGDISGWNVSNVERMGGMFTYAKNFNQSLNDWDVSNVRDIKGMFREASSFNQPLNDWDVSNVANMQEVFYRATNFNGNISSWDVSNVKYMGSMFYGATNFNGDISGWNTSKVKDIKGMFREASSFNQPLNDWDVSNVANTQDVFYRATSFNQPLGKWNVSIVTKMKDMFKDVKLSTENYDDLLIGWEAKGVRDNINFHGGYSQYCLGEDARNSLETNYNWTITDGGKNCSTPSFVSIWQVSDEEKIVLPIFNGGNYNFEVDWGDNSTSYINSWDSVNRTHEYTTANTYTIKITGTLEGWNFGKVPNSKDNIIDITHWGDMNLVNPSNLSATNIGGYFKVTNNLENISAVDTPNLMYATNLTHMFYHSVNFNGDLSSWDISNVNDISFIFYDALLFDQPLNTWNTSNVITMESVFDGASIFNQPLDNWDTSKVTNMESVFDGTDLFNQFLNGWNTSNVKTMRDMFDGALSFNQPLSNWDVSNVEDMSGMFGEAKKFNQSLSNWDVSNVINMYGMFTYATNFDQPLNNWDVSNVEDMSGMFWRATSFNQPLNEWKVSKVTDMNSMFYRATNFNGNISTWEVSKVTDMDSMFEGAESFNQPLNEWDVSSVTNMEGMFEEAIDFNQPLDKWDVSNVEDMSYMFSIATSFNQPLGNWNVSKVTDMGSMFEGAESFDQPLGNWNVSNVEDMSEMFSGVILSTENYDNLLIGWESKGVQSDVVFSGGNSQYCLGEYARDSLTGNYNWTITDGSKNCGFVCDVYVDDDYDESTPGWQYNKFNDLQDGINAVGEYCTVYLMDGTYYNNYTITKPLNLIGESIENTLLDVNQTKKGMVIYSTNNVTLSTFSIFNGLIDQNDPNTLISNSNSSNVSLYYIEMYNSYSGYGIFNVGENIFATNLTIYDSVLGLLLLGNTNTNTNIHLSNINSYNNSIGIGFGSCNGPNIIIENNYVHNNEEGILLYNSNNITLRNNYIFENTEVGIIFEDDEYLISINNLIYNNIFRNNPTHIQDEFNNHYNITKTYGTNIVGGPYLGGNYYDNYLGEDTNGDGLGDTLVPYASNGGIKNGGDYHPLVIDFICDVYVDDDYDESTPGWQYNKFNDVQDGINAVGEYCTVYLMNGTYYNNYTVTKPLNIIGESVENTIINANETNTTAYLYIFSTNNVSVSNLTIFNGYIVPDDDDDDERIYGAIISENSFNISINNVKIYEVNAGFVGLGGTNIFANNLTIFDCGVGAGFLEGDLATFSNSYIYNCNVGFYMVETNSSNVLLENNTISNILVGVYFLNSNYTVIKNNIIKNSELYGILFSSQGDDQSYYNLIYNNIFRNNSIQVYDEYENYYNITKTLGANIINGSYLGGNYWDDYMGVDTDGDGLGDTLLPYNSSGNIQKGGDYRPLVFDLVCDVYVDDDYNSSTSGWQYDHFDDLQDGINAVGEYCTVYLMNGTYYNDYTITKPLNLIGESVEGTLIDVNETITFSGILINSTNNVTLSNFSIFNGYILENNSFFLIASLNSLNIYLNNIELYDGDIGYVSYADVGNISVTNLTLHDLGGGIGIGNNNNNNIHVSGINSYNNQMGFIVGESNGSSIVLENSFIHDNPSNIVLSFSYNIIIRNNIIENSYEGIVFSNDENVTNTNNLIYNNIFRNNTYHILDVFENYYNITKTLGTNIIGGPYLGGNYYDDYLGEDTDGDGLGNTLLPYNSTGGIENGGDYLPLTYYICLNLNEPLSFFDRVYLENDSYYFNEDITLCPNLTYNLNTTDVLLNFNTSLNNITFDCSNSLFIGNGSGTLLESINMNNVTIMNCFVQNYNLGFNIVNTNHSYFYNNHANYSSNGIYIYNSSIEVENSTFYNNSNYGIYINSDSNISLSYSRSCSNRVDINSQSLSTLGHYNRCNSFLNWTENERRGCALTCSEIWHRFSGKIDGSLILSDNLESFYLWDLDDFSNGNIYAVYSGLDVNWNEIYSIGKTKLNTSSSNDFEILDNVFSLPDSLDNINYLYSVDGSQPKYTINMTLFNREVPHVPVANSTFLGLYQTGILWDGSDTLSDEFSGDEDVIFVGEIKYTEKGTYVDDISYEIMFPKDLNNPNKEIYFYIELK